MTVTEFYAASVLYPIRSRRSPTYFNSPFQTVVWREVGVGGVLSITRRMLHTTERHLGEWADRLTNARLAGLGLSLSSEKTLVLVPASWSSFSGVCFMSNTSALIHMCRRHVIRQFSVLNSWIKDKKLMENSHRVIYGTNLLLIGKQLGISTQYP